MSGRDGFSRTQSANSEQSVLSCYNEAVKYHKAGLLDDAENKFRQALLKHKRHVPSIVGLGSLLREMGRGEEGKKLLQEASGMISAGDPAASISLANRTAAMGKFQRTSSLSQYTSVQHPKITSLKQAGQTVKTQIHMLKIARAFGANTTGSIAKLLNRPVGGDSVLAQGASSMIFSRIPSAPADAPGPSESAKSPSKDDISSKGNLLRASSSPLRDAGMALAFKRTMPDESASRQVAKDDVSRPGNPAFTSVVG